jgi:hypothetical protein
MPARAVINLYGLSSKAVLTAPILQHTGSNIDYNIAAVADKSRHHSRWNTTQCIMQQTRI